MGAITQSVQNKSAIFLCYYDKIWKHKHKMNITKLRNKIVHWTCVEQTKGNGGSYFYIYPFGDLVQWTSMEVSMCSLIKEVFFNVF
jgi:hypothetical protein